jgi:hypothetical protein
VVALEPWVGAVAAASVAVEGPSQTRLCSAAVAADSAVGEAVSVPSVASVAVVGVAATLVELGQEQHVQLTGQAQEAAAGEVDDLLVHEAASGPEVVVLAHAAGSDHEVASGPSADPLNQYFRAGLSVQPFLRPRQTSPWPVW